ncbi:hypothetical protein PAXRUDRAFT_174407 [Paxillus rubicundulus Ve08.2h10]|uniref:Uncharacterized protein n=1 Tax=Paxillus rubicundulus Ve08.2h10 TaxID=930991 RepID=A0A0D0DC82_9AGAM|nr:hypothetical protein PAXRUDRAFT_174407 [Paxillus rubicundulus Ve08.2h10]
MGISVSVDAINAAVRSLSAESHRAIQSLGRTLLAAYAYNNFDVNHTAEKSTELLKHLTSGLLFPLAHGVKTEDLRCSKELWEKLPLNPKVEPSILVPCKG